MLNKVILLLLVFIFSFNKTDAGWEKIFLESDRIRVLHFFNYNSGYAVSYSGIVFKTTNAGINWSSNALGKNVYAGEFFNDSNYILTGNNEYNNGWIGVFKNNIRTDFIIYPELLLFLHFFSASWIDINTGFVAGSEFDYSGQLGKIFKTTNSGLNWINISTPSGLFVNDIKFLNISKGFVLDPSAKFTTNSGINWTLCENSSVGGIKFDLVNEDTMYIAGYNGALFFSSNGGNNWTNRSPGNYSLCDVKFFDARTGWVCGLNGKIFKTTNAGELWNIQSSNTLNGLWCIFVADDNNVLIGGDSGIILKTTNGGITGFRNESNEIANKFILEQNFPNPFNQLSIIQFKVASSKFIKLVVYDILGKEVKTLVNEYKLAGTYHVSFNAEGLSSGVYFYRMTAGDFIATKKFILLK